MKAKAHFNTILNRLPITSIAAKLFLNKGEVCSKLNNVLKQSE